MWDASLWEGLTPGMYSGRPAAAQSAIYTTLARPDTDSSGAHRRVAPGAGWGRCEAVKLFWTLFSIDAVVAAIVLFFFFAGLGDGTVSSYNIVLWLAILGVLAAVIGGGLLLK